MSDPCRVPKARYYSGEFFDEERERLWPRVWQAACRLEQIPNIGDYVEYTILDQSVLVVRSTADEVKAYFNSCRHRGTQLASGCGYFRGKQIVCPFHGWSWKLDGSSSFVYEERLFRSEDVDRADLRLRECQVDTWGGFVFITMDPAAPPLRTFLEPTLGYLEHMALDRMRLCWWRSTVVPANWKLTLEAFMEAYHVMRTHPQLMVGQGPDTYYGQTLLDADVDTQIEHLRLLCEGMDGMVLQKDLDVAARVKDRDVPPREFNWELLGEWRTEMGKAGIDAPDLQKLSRRGLLPGGVYHLFPNLSVSPYFGNAYVYRSRPIDAETCLFEIGSMTLQPDDHGASPPETEHLALEDPRWPRIAAQDFSNIPRQQVGLHTRGFEFMRLSNAVEGRISAFQYALDGYLDDLSDEQLLPLTSAACGAIDSRVVDPRVFVGQKPG